MKGQDALTNWITDYCELDANAWEHTQTLFADWKAYCDKTGEFAGTMKPLFADVGDAWRNPPRDLSAPLDARPRISRLAVTTTFDIPITRHHRVQDQVAPGAIMFRPDDRRCHPTPEQSLPRPKTDHCLAFAPVDCLLVILISG
jgi:hypothetical protein